MICLRLHCLENIYDVMIINFDNSTTGRSAQVFRLTMCDGGSSEP